MLDTQTMHSAMKALFEYIGFKNEWQVSVAQNFNRPGLNIGVYTNIEHIQTPEDLYNLSESIRKDLTASDTFKDITDAAVSEAKKYEEENRALRVEIEDLRRYKTYYELELGLRKG